MNDLELKNLLHSTCPVRPGQEARAWSALQPRLTQRASRGPLLSWFSFVAARPIAYGITAVVVGVAIFDLGLTMRPDRPALAFADSQVPGIYATSFYSHSAQAQVIWLNGMEPASDQPTYLDPTTKVGTGHQTHPAKDSDSL